MKEAGLTDVRTSINRRQNTVAQYIATRPLLDLCKGGDAERRSAGDTEMVVAEGHILGEGQGKGSGNRIGVQLGDRHGGVGGSGNRKQDKRLKWGGMERGECGRMGSTDNEITYYIGQSLVTG